MVEFLISRSWLCLSSVCFVHCFRDFKGALRLSEFESRKHISGIKLFASKIAKYFSCGAVSHRDVVFLRSPKTFSSPSWLCIMLHVLSSLLGVLREAKRVVAFPHMLRLDPGSFIKLL